MTKVKNRKRKFCEDGTEVSSHPNRNKTKNKLKNQIYPESEPEDYWVSRLRNSGGCKLKFFFKKTVEPRGIEIGQKLIYLDNAPRSPVRGNCEEMKNKNYYYSNLESKFDSEDSSDSEFDDIFIPISPRKSVKTVSKTSSVESRSDELNGATKIKSLPKDSTTPKTGDADFLKRRPKKKRSSKSTRKCKNKENSIPRERRELASPPTPPPSFCLSGVAQRLAGNTWSANRDSTSTPTGNKGNSDEDSPNPSTSTGYNRSPSPKRDSVSTPTRGKEAEKRESESPLSGNNANTNKHSAKTTRDPPTPKKAETPAEPPPPPPKPKSRRQSLEIKRKMTNEKPFNCKECGKGFWAKGSLQTHARIHNNDRPFKCEHCPKQFTRSTSLYNHIRSTHEMNKPKRPIKPKGKIVPEPEDELLAYLKLQRKPRKPKKAPLPESPTKRPEHREVSPNTDSEIDIKPSILIPESVLLKSGQVQVKLERFDDPKEPVLGYLFSQSGTPCVKQEKVEDEWIYPFIFEEDVLENFDFEHFILSKMTGDDYEATQEEEDDGAIGNEDDYLIATAKCFVTEDPTPAPTAEENVIQNSNVKKHAKYDCIACGKRFSIPGAFISHMRIFHRKSKQWSKCNECEKEFRSYAWMLSHMNRHTGERPYACLRCQKTFTDIRSLGYHTRTVHLRRTRVIKVAKNKKLKRKILTKAKGRLIPSVSTNSTLSSGTSFDSDFITTPNQNETESIKAFDSCASFLASMDLNTCESDTNSDFIKVSVPVQRKSMSRRTSKETATKIASQPPDSIGVDDKTPDTVPMEFQTTKVFAPRKSFNFFDQAKRFLEKGIPTQTPVKHPS